MSTLLATTSTGFFDLRRICATYWSRSVIPLITSTTNMMTSASSIAMLTCLLISSSKMSSELTTQPPVSTTENSFPHHSHSPYWRSRVVPDSSLTIARRLSVRRLNSVDFPTFGRPTMATKFPIDFCCFYVADVFGVCHNGLNICTFWLASQTIP